MVRDTTPVAVKALLPNDLSRLAPGTGSSEVGTLPTNNYGWFELLQAFGYPCQNTADTTDIDPQHIYAMAGPGPWALPLNQLESLLNHATVLLDAEAADVIRQRDLGQLIGLKDVHWHCHNNDEPFSIEQALGQVGDDIPQRSGVNFVPDDWLLATFDTASAARPRTEILDCYLKSLGTGTYLYTNEAGGRGLVLPMTLPLCGPLYDWNRKHWLDQFLSEICDPLPVPFLTETPWVLISARQSRDHRTVFLANPMFETYEQLRIQLPPAWIDGQWNCQLHSRDKPTNIEVDKTGILTIHTEFVGADWLMLAGRIGLDTTATS